MVKEYKKWARTVIPNVLYILGPFSNSKILAENLMGLRDQSKESSNCRAVSHSANESVQNQRNFL